MEEVFSQLHWVKTAENKRTLLLNVIPVGWVIHHDSSLVTGTSFECQLTTCFENYDAAREAVERCTKYHIVHLMLRYGKWPSE